MPKNERSTRVFQFPDVRCYRAQLHELADLLADAIEAGDVELLNAEHSRLEGLFIEARSALGTNRKDKRDPKVWGARFAALDLHDAAAAAERGRELPANIAKGIAVLMGERQTDGRSHESDRSARLLSLLEHARRQARRRGTGPTEADAAFVVSTYAETFPAEPDVARARTARSAILEYLRVVTAPAKRGAGAAGQRKDRAQIALAAVHKALGLPPARLDSLKRQSRRRAKSGQ